MIMLTILILIESGSSWLILSRSPLAGQPIQQIFANTVVTPFVATVWTLVYYRHKGQEDEGRPAGRPRPSPD